MYLKIYNFMRLQFFKIKEFGDIFINPFQGKKKGLCLKFNFSSKQGP